MSRWIEPLLALFRRPEQKQQDTQAQAQAYSSRLFEICVFLQNTPAETRAVRPLKPPCLDGFLFQDDAVPADRAASHARTSGVLGIEMQASPGILRVTPTLLRQNPRLQAKLAILTAYTPGAWLLECELQARKANKTVASNDKSSAEIGTGLNATSDTLKRLEEEIEQQRQVFAAESAGRTQGTEDWNEPATSPLRSSARDELDRLRAKAAELRRSYEDDLRLLVEMQGAGHSPTLSPCTADEPTLTADDIVAAAAAQNLAGLCFSGGGIRSATFSLGVLQALASKRFLRRFDYLSTVSGGGYIHQWLAAWIRNSHDAPGAFAFVERQLTPPADPDGPAKSPEAIEWLRRYCSYLTPQRGIFSLDTWTMLAIWFRNTFLNQLVLFSFIACGLVASLATSHPFIQELSASTSFSLRGWPLILLVFLGIALSTLRMVFALNSVTAPAGALQQLSRFGRWSVGSLGKTGVFCWLVLPTFAMAYLVALESADSQRFGPHRFGLQPALGCYGLYIFCLLLAVTFGGRAPRDYSDLVPKAPVLKWGAVCCSILTAALFTVSVLAPIRAFVDPPDAFRHLSLLTVADRVAGKANGWFDHHADTMTMHRKDAAGTLDVSYSEQVADTLNPPFQGGMVVATALPPLLYFLFFVALRLQTGVLGRYYAESRREWLARFGALGGQVGVVWIVLALVSRVGPVLFNWLVHGSTLRLASALLTTVAVHAVTLYAGASGKADGEPKAKSLLGYSMTDLLGIVGAPVCVVLLLMICSGLLRHLLNACDRVCAVHSYAQWQGDAMVGALFAATLLFFGWRVDVNEFSMHGYYRNRLARGYLGGANAHRMPDPFTGFDDHDETNYSQTGIRLAELLPDRFGGPGKYDGPFPIFCSTLNLNFGEDLAWQERKGASFAFTPLYSGYNVGWTAEGDMGRLNQTEVHTNFNGYVPTSQYAYPNEGIGLSTVTAICGAALSPNQGYNSQPALAFLMTLFNVRLGWWIANPRRSKVWPATSRCPTPIFGLWYLLQELLGMADDTQNYVFLSDGGHFENMGMYELVRRRCRLIVVCDGEMDCGPKFDGIGNAIAKCRTDFGTEITLDLTPLLPARETGLATQHCVWGTVRYPMPPMSKLLPADCIGYVVYLKTSITGEEPADILHHRLAYPDFPQDTTLNQWFTESQFESYRRLGQVVGEEAYRTIAMCTAALAAGGTPLQPPCPGQRA